MKPRRIRRREIEKAVADTSEMFLLAGCKLCGRRVVNLTPEGTYTPMKGVNIIYEDDSPVAFTICPKCNEEKT